MDTVQLLKEARQGSAAAQKYLFDIWSGKMMLVCVRYLKNEQDAEEVLLDGFYKFFKNLPGFTYNGEAALHGWLKKIMVNECLMFLRKKHKALLFPEENLPQVPVNAAILMQLDAEALNSLILQLPMGYRTVFNLYVVEGYDHKEIAAMLNINENTSRSQLMKAKGKLKAMVEQKNISYEMSHKNF